MMADAHGKLTGRPGICFVTRGPGATNASAGMHIAMQDSTPMILFIGQVAARRARARGVPGNRLHALLRRSRQMGGRDRRCGAHAGNGDPRLRRRDVRAGPGPVVVSLPEDMLTAEADAPAALPATPVETVPGEAADAIVSPSLLERRGGRSRFSAAPAGRRGEGGAWKSRRSAWALPVGCSFRRQMLFDHLHPSYAGDVGIGPNPALADASRTPTSSCSSAAASARCRPRIIRCSKIPYPDQRLVHVHPDAGELGRVYQADLLAINATPRSFAAALEKLVPEGIARWAEETERLHAAYLALVDAAGYRPRAGADGPDHRPCWRRCCRTTRSSPTAPATTPPGCTASTASAASARRRRRPPAPWATAAGRRRRQGALSRPHGDRLCRRRLLPDERPGIRHRRPVRPADHRHRRQQRHLRHDPHAPGAPLSRPRRRRPISAIPISPPLPAPMAATARRSRPRPNSPPPSSARSPRGKPAIIEIRLDPEAITPTRTLSEIRERR